MSRFNTLRAGDCLYSALFHGRDSVGSVLFAGFGPCQCQAAHLACAALAQPWGNK